MAEQIVYSDANTMGVNTPLFTFDSIYDTDFGMLVYIFREYFDTEIFSEEFFNTHNAVDKMVEALYNRETENPLLIAMNDKTNFDLADELYQEFYNKKYKEILTCSMPTGISDLLELLEAESGVNIGILVCRTEEKYFIDALWEDNKFHYIDINNPEDINSIRRYNQIYFKSCNDRFITDESVLDKLYEKNIYIPRYKFNLNETEDIFRTIPIIKLEMNRCSFFKYDIYDLSEETNEEENAE